MVKFASPEDEDYKTVSSHLLLMCRDAPNRIAAVWEDGQAPSRATPNQIVASSLAAVLPSANDPRTSVARYQVRAVQTSGSSQFLSTPSPGAEESGGVSLEYFSFPKLT